MRESDILHENGKYWVCKTQAGYMVFRSGFIYAESVGNTAYESNPEGLSIAIAKCDYLANRYNPSRIKRARRKHKAKKVKA